MRKKTHTEHAICFAIYVCVRLIMKYASRRKVVAAPLNFKAQHNYTRGDHTNECRRRRDACSLSRTRPREVCLGFLQPANVISIYIYFHPSFVYVRICVCTRPCHLHIGACAAISAQHVAHYYNVHTKWAPARQDGGKCRSETRTYSHAPISCACIRQTFFSTCPRTRNPKPPLHIMGTLPPGAHKLSPDKFLFRRPCTCVRVVFAAGLSRQSGGIHDIWMEKQFSTHINTSVCDRSSLVVELFAFNSG